MCEEKRSSTGRGEHGNHGSSASGTPGNCHMLTNSHGALGDSNAQLTPGL